MASAESNVVASLPEEDSPPRKKRTRRACDQCSVSRTKCDGNMPCQRCANLLIACGYARQRKKRGKGSDLYLSKRYNMAHSRQKSSAPETAVNPGSFLTLHDFDGSTMSGGIMDTSPKSSTHSSVSDSYGTEALMYHNPETAIHEGSLHLSFHRNGDQPLISESVFNSPRWLNMSTPFPTELFATTHPSRRLSSSSIQYPVLLPVVSSLTFMEPELAADLMEVYFSSTVYGVAPIIRKCSLLSLHKPRVCSPALLFSFMLVSAHASDHPLMKATPTTRETIITKLTDLVVSHVKPLRHTGPGAGTLDDVIAYLHIGIVSSASELKGASMRWWHAAWGLARVLKFNQEDPTLDEERREEQRRTWWLLFLIDRHLALCYNRPLALLDSECADLYVPVSEDQWTSDLPLTPAAQDPLRPKGPVFQIYDSGLFGMYLPLMALLGGIIDLHFLALNTSLSVSDEVMATLRASYVKRLDQFESSIDRYKRDSETVGVYIQAWKEYCRCLVHVFHILLQGHLDPIELLNSIQSLVEDPAFDCCVHHSIAAARCIERILVLDPDLRLIPFFFGIQLLQGGFILLCMADKFEQDTTNEVRVACEILVRAHEVCIVTLNTEYQRNFRQILRGTIRSMTLPKIAGMSGIGLQEDAKNRRREVLGLYRWCSGGTGLAI
jgi:hypothetical protein